MTTRNWSLRTRITALLLVPLVALLVLWVFAVSLTARPVIQLLHFRSLAHDVAAPLEVLVTEVQQERQLSLVFLGGDTAMPSLDEQRHATDSAADAFRRQSSHAAAQLALDQPTTSRLDDLLDTLTGLGKARSEVDQRGINRTGALASYSTIVDSAFQLMPALAEVGDDELVRRSRTVTDLARARELLAQENAMVAGAVRAGRFVDDEASKVGQLIGLRRLLTADAVAALPESGRRAFNEVSGSAEYNALVGLEDVLVAQGRAGERPPIGGRQWAAAATAVAAAERGFENRQARVVADMAEPIAVAIVLRLALAGLLGLLALIATSLISVRIARSLLERLGQLRRNALELADHQLPGVVGRLRRGEPVDVAAETPPIAYGSDEIGELGRAFAEVHRTAVAAAVDEAALRRGMSEVFLNIARRNQTLLYRQLALLDQLEREPQAPEQMADLFRLDHLATRMRRHAEDLVILAGARPSRGWREPVPLVDVVRGAVSEVEDYARVDVREVPTVGLVGRAVGDVIHLVAELLENATAFSPPQSRVRVTAQAVPSGVALEIEDRGLGMTAEALAEANGRLTEPPDFDPANSARLGLFVVAQLARRHGITVTLVHSGYGGVTAVVLVPALLVAELPAGLPARSTRRDGRLRAVPALAPPQELPPVAAPSVLRAPAGEMSADGLPRRVRQASLAPGLVGVAAPPPPEPAVGTARPVAGALALPSGGRTPGEIRHMMSELQTATRRGRVDGAAAVRELPALPAPRSRSAAGEDG